MTKHGIGTSVGLFLMDHGFKMMIFATVIVTFFVKTGDDVIREGVLCFVSMLAGAIGISDLNFKAIQKLDEEQEARNGR